MANNLGSKVAAFTKRLDTIVMQETCTADLNMNQDLLGEFTGKGTVKIAKIAMDGLADHERGGGFVAGGVTLDWEEKELEFERDREFSIDVLDDEERELLVSANVMGEFARTKVVPEVDAIRFARLAENAGNTESAALTTGAAVESAVLLAEEAMQDAGEELSGCVLYMTSHMKTLLRQAQPYRMGQGEAPNGNFDTFDDMRIRIVPTARFFSAIDLLDGKSEGETAGGYKKSSEGVGINFMVLSPKACAAITKHEKLRYFAPDVNQDDDAHKWQYRLFHDLLVYENRKALIYAHLATA
ncbi:MAG: hypothetical protein IJ111_05805 [Eggerthellaceae bacterium]|nr:hypothetical protein [Eggerthellaceae bacterium]